MILGVKAMAKVLAVHELTLRPGAAGREEEFERLVAEEVRPAYKAGAGVEARLLKGVRGDRAGGYTLLLEFPSAEAFARFFPIRPGPATAETAKALREHAALIARYESFVRSRRVTDYLETAP